MKVGVEIDHVDLENDDGITVAGVMATCSECQHTTESFGESNKSIKRCLVLMRQECPRDEKNFYVADELEDE